MDDASGRRGLESAMPPMMSDSSPHPAATPLPIARPLIGEEEARAVARVLKTGWVTQGPEVEAFEREFAVYVGAPHACAVSSCTAALHLALVALEVGAGDEVITVSHSFIATANAVRYVHAVPVFVDVDPVNGNILPDQIAAAITPRTRAILAVHQLGMPCDLPAILAIADSRGVPVIEDAACALGSEIRMGPDAPWERIGRPRGRIACFSFHPRKILTTGDGGMLTTADAEIHRRLRLLRQHGMSVSDRVRHAATTVEDESYEFLGFNYRMTDIQAAIGRVQLSRLPALVQERRARADEFRRLLSPINGLGLPGEPRWARSNWQTWFVRLPDGADQKRFRQAMLDRGIATRRGVMCAHREPAYAEAEWRTISGKASAALRNGESIQDCGVALPLFPGMSDVDQSRIADAVRECLVIAGGEG